MDFEKVSFRPSPEEQYYLERLNEHYNASTITEFFRRLLGDCRRWQIGNIDVDRQSLNGPTYPTNVNIIPRNEAHRNQYQEPDFEMQLIVAQQALQLRQMQEAMMQMSFQLQSMRQQQYQQQYMYFQSPNAGWFGNQFGFVPPFPTYTPPRPEQEIIDPITIFTNGAERALRFKNAFKALWP